MIGTLASSFGLSDTSSHGVTRRWAYPLLRSNARVVEEETESWEIEDVSLEDEDDTPSVTNGPTALTQVKWCC